MRPLRWSGVFAGALVLAPLVSSACEDAAAGPGTLPGAATERPGITLARRGSGLATPLVGVAYGEEARVHITVLHPPEPVGPNPIHPPEPVHLLLGLVSEDDVALAQQTFDLLPGESATLEARGPGTDRGRMLVRAAVTSVPDATGLISPDPFAGGGIQASLEIVDTDTLRTDVVVNPVEIFGFNPQPEPPAR